MTLLWRFMTNSVTWAKKQTCRKIVGNCRDVSKKCRKLSWTPLCEACLGALKPPTSYSCAHAFTASPRGRMASCWACPLSRLGRFEGHIPHVLAELLGAACMKSDPILERREPPLTLRREKQYLYFGHFFPCTPGPFSCSTGLFVYHSHKAGPVLQEFGLVLRVGVRHSTSVLRPLPWG